MRFDDDSYIENGFLKDSAGQLVVLTYSAGDADTYYESNGLLVAPGSQTDGGGLVVIEA